MTPRQTTKIVRHRQCGRNKLCLSCLTIKPVERFVKHPRGSGGVSSICKSCNVLERRSTSVSRTAKQEDA